MSSWTVGVGYGGEGHQISVLVLRPIAQDQFLPLLRDSQMSTRFVIDHIVLSLIQIMETFINLNDLLSVIHL